MINSLPSDVPEMVAPEVAQRRWAERAQERLEPLTEAVADLRVALDASGVTGTAQGAQSASGVKDACIALTEWLDSSRAPRGLRKAEGELGATAGVYRNAAVAFGSLSDADAGQFAARHKACGNLLQQGDDHVEVFRTLLRKKLQS